MCCGDVLQFVVYSHYGWQFKGNSAFCILKQGTNAGELVAREKLFAEQVRTYVPADDYRVLGTDGFGRSDSRENLRHHFEVDASYVVVAALGELAKRGEIDKKVVADAIAKFNIDADKVNPRLA